MLYFYYINTNYSTTDNEDGIEEEIERVLTQDSEDVMSQQEVTSQPEVVVSPVPTPYMYRPETRDQQRLSLQERVRRILRGSVVTSFVPDKRLVTIFISGHCTGTLFFGLYCLCRTCHLISSQYHCIQIYIL